MDKFLSTQKYILTETARTGYIAQFDKTQKLMCSVDGIRLVSNVH